jgi:hypothetical protein
LNLSRVFGSVLESMLLADPSKNLFQQTARGVTSQISRGGATNGIGPLGNTRFGMPGSGFRLTSGARKAVQDLHEVPLRGHLQ